MTVVVEETIVLHNIKDVLAFAMLMGVIYSMKLGYPNAMKYSFGFLQRVVMKINQTKLRSGFMDQGTKSCGTNRNIFLRFLNLKH